MSIGAAYLSGAVNVAGLVPGEARCRRAAVGRAAGKAVEDGLVPVAGAFGAASWWEAEA